MRMDAVLDQAFFDINVMIQKGEVFQRNVAAHNIAIFFFCQQVS